MKRKKDKIDRLLETVMAILLALATIFVIYVTMAILNV